MSAAIPTDPIRERRSRVHPVLKRWQLTPSLTFEDANLKWMHERFVARARALFYARMMFLTLGLLILAVPVWSRYFALTGPLAFGGYFLMLMYSIANYLVLEHRYAGRIVTYVTLCLDLMIMVYLIVRGGGLQSPLLATQLLFTTLFAILFPRPLAILPPLLSLLITTRIDQLLDRAPTAVEVLTLLWYSALNFIIIYVLVYMNEQEVAAHREIGLLQGDLKEMAVIDERNRLAREIHDGLGASLSSLIIQSEYLLSLSKEPAILQEVRELKASAEESIEELRRSLRMMREDFDLGNGMEEYIKTFRDRAQLDVRFASTGVNVRLSPEKQLALFRVLQESLSNVAKHAAAKTVEVKLYFGHERIDLSIKDDGQGFDPRLKKSGHYGLINMHERAMKMGADLSIDSGATGTQVSFSVPIHSNKRHGTYRT